ncbi:MAG: hypothetical protein ACXWQQ_01520 [Pseudobdellovibrio sp.]
MSTNVEMEIKKSSLGSVQIPEGNSIDFMSEEVISTVGLPMLIVLAEIYSDEIKEILKRYQTIEEVILSGSLKTEAVLAQTAFWEDVLKINFLIENEIVDYLVTKKFVTDDRESVSSYLARVFPDNQNLFRDYLKNIVTKNGGSVAKRRYQVFQGTQINDENVKNITVESLRANLDLHCTDITPIKHPEAVAFLVQRDTKPKNRMVLDIEKKKRCRGDSDLKTDAVFYYPETNTLWIYCVRKNDIEKYTDAFGKILENPTAFQLKQHFNMKPFLNVALGSALYQAIQNQEETAEVVRVEVKMIDIELAEGGGFDNSAKGPTKCLTSLFHQMSAVSPVNDMKAIRLRLVLSNDGKVYGDLEIQSGNLKIGNNLSLKTISQFLVKLGVWETHAEA